MIKRQADLFFGSSCHACHASHVRRGYTKVIQKIRLFIYLFIYYFLRTLDLLPWTLDPRPKPKLNLFASQFENTYYASATFSLRLFFVSFF